jgi:cell fate (sporulation/competence/biofilm development) regulator YmcA (YheA/YmcA/DUF963 family)
MDILEFINSYWSVLAFVGVVIVSWVRYESKVNSLEAKDHEQENAIKELRNDMKASEKVISTFGKDMVEVKTMLQFITETLKKLDK